MKDIDIVDNNTEQSQETQQPAHVVSRAEMDGVHDLANRMLQELSKLPDGDLVGEMIANNLKLFRDNANRGDMKLMMKSFKELRYALKIFAPYRQTRKVSIFGSARTPESHPDYLAAAEFGKKMAALGYMVITGAGGGIMAAGHGGAGAEPSFGLAIRLPFEQKTNAFIEGDPKLINFKYFFTRKLMFVRSSHATAIFPGGFGTMDEGFEVLTLVQTGKSVPQPIVFVEAKGGDYWAPMQQFILNTLLKRGLIGHEDLHLYKITDDIDEAVQDIAHFYSNYHSLRYTRDELLLRIKRAPNAKQLDEIKATFDHLGLGNKNAAFRVTEALPIERDEPALANLARLAFKFNQRDQGGLRLLINYLNNMPT